MKAGNQVTHEPPNAQITQYVATSSGAKGGLLHRKLPTGKSQGKLTLQENAKITTMDENNRNVSFRAAPSSKKRTLQENAKNKTMNVNNKNVFLHAPTLKRPALRDVTNIHPDNSRNGAAQAAKTQAKAHQHINVVGPSKVKNNTDYKNNESVNSSIPDKDMAVIDCRSDKLSGEVQDAATLHLKGNVLVKSDDSLIAPQRLESIKDGSREVKIAFTSRKNAVKVPNTGDHGNQTTLRIINIDAGHSNTLLCGIYAARLYAKLQILERFGRPSSDYMEALQKYITPCTRGILVDWLVEVSEEYKLVPDTLYLTVYLIDRFLSGNVVERSNLQLLGITCMLIASKYEEICAPLVQEFCVITANTYKKEEVFKMERQILNHVSFKLSVPTTKTFLRRFLLVAQACYNVPSLPLGDCSLGRFSGSMDIGSVCSSMEFDS